MRKRPCTNLSHSDLVIYRNQLVQWYIFAYKEIPLPLKLGFFEVVKAIIDSRFITLLNENRDNPLVADCLERISQTDEVRYKGYGIWDMGLSH